MLTLRAPSWPRRKTSPSPSSAKENRSESDDPKSNLNLSAPPPAAEPEPVPNGRFGAKNRLRKRRSGSLSPMKADGTPRPASSEVTRRRAVFSDDRLDRFLARRLNDRAIFAARQAVFTCCDLLGLGAAAALDAGGDPAETATVLRPLVDLARREFGAEHEVTARLAADLTRALYLAGASADDLLEAEALRRESLTGGAAVLDASHEEYVRREELVAAAREVGWEPFSCEEIRAVTLER